jgi:hypothetical protein
VLCHEQQAARIDRYERSLFRVDLDEEFLNLHQVVVAGLLGRVIEYVLLEVDVVAILLDTDDGERVAYLRAVDADRERAIE